MTPDHFYVRSKIRDSIDGPVVDVRIKARIPGTTEQFLSPSSFIVDLQGIPALLNALKRVHRKATREGLFIYDDDLDARLNAHVGGHV